MRNRLSTLHRGILGVALASSLTFGAAQAFASPDAARTATRGSCQPYGQPYLPGDCPECNGGHGYCDGYNTHCICS